MITNRFLSSFRFDAIKLVSVLFIAIPLVVMSVIYTFLAGGSVEQIFLEPILTVQFITLLTYPFCYLFMKSIRKMLDTQPSFALHPLWMLTLCQLLAFNMICFCLLLFGMYQQYGKDMFSLRSFGSGKANHALMISFCPVLLLLVFVLVVKFRLGMF